MSYSFCPTIKKNKQKKKEEQFQKVSNPNYVPPASVKKEREENQKSIQSKKFIVKAKIIDKDAWVEGYYCWNDLLIYQKHYIIPYYAIGSDKIEFRTRQYTKICVSRRYK